MDITLLLLLGAGLFMLTSGSNKDIRRGIRNNNPGNLVITPINWKGKIPVDQNTDKVYEQFIAPEYGIRALYLDLKNDIERDGLNTIEKLIPAYAPPHENPTQNYINFVSAKTAILPFQPLFIFNYTAILKAIIEFENGENPYSDDLIRKAIYDT